MGFIYMLYIFLELLLFSVINIFVIKHNLCEDISIDVSVYLSNCGSVVETASDSVCYGLLCGLVDHKLVQATHPAPSNFYCWPSQGGSSVLILW